MIQLPKNAKNLTGQKFNRLTAIEPVGVYRGVRKNGKPYSGGVYWRCICDCGKESTVLASALSTGKIRSCGCLAKETAKEIAQRYRKSPEDLTGNRYGQLTVAGKDTSFHKGHSTYWWCQCDCGSEPKSICASHLKSGKTVSCGCKTSELISIARKRAPHKVERDDNGVFFVSKNQIVRFDEEDIDVATACLWNIDTVGYCRGLLNGVDTRFHREIMRKYYDIDGVEIDHKNGDINDNRKSNLRIATHSENMKNSHERPRGSRLHKGVSQKTSGKWLSEITCDGERVRVGLYDDFDDACKAREEAELLLFGEFSRLATLQQ